LTEAIGQPEVERIIGEAFTQAEQDKASNNKGGIVARPFVWRDPASISPRQWLYGRHYVRQYLSCTIAPGGLGKTSLAIVDALVMASGRPLLGIAPQKRLRVWLWNGEDPRDELERRIIAAMLHFGLKPEDIDGYLFLNVGRETPIIVATQTRNATIIAKPVVDAVIETITRNKIDVTIIDPFIKSHKVNENDNMAIDAVATQWGQIADITVSSVEVLHHPRKTGSNEVTVEDGRGASSLVNASRSARVLNIMNKEQAKQAGIKPETTWRYFRVDNGKASMAPRPENADWYQLKSIALGNGDNVGVADTWEWPDPFKDVTTGDLLAAQKAVAQDGPWRESSKAKQWVDLDKADNAKFDDDRRVVVLCLHHLEGTRFDPFGQ
jgi:RecA-family ATPase